MKKRKTEKKAVNAQKSPHAHYKEIADNAVALQIFDIIERNPKISQKKN